MYRKSEASRVILAESNLSSPYLDKSHYLWTSVTALSDRVAPGGGPGVFRLYAAVRPGAGGGIGFAAAPGRPPLFPEPTAAFTCLFCLRTPAFALARRVAPVGGFRPSLSRAGPHPSVDSGLRSRALSRTSQTPAFPPLYRVAPVESHLTDSSLHSPVPSRTRRWTPAFTLLCRIAPVGGLRPSLSCAESHPSVDSGLRSSAPSRTRRWTLTFALARRVAPHGLRPSLPCTESHLSVDSGLRSRALSRTRRWIPAFALAR